MKVLFCGGHANGQWRELAPDVEECEVVVPGGFGWDGPRVVKGRQTYHVWTTDVMGRSIRVATLPQPLGGVSEAMIRAMFQRDVANHLLGVR